MSLGATDELVGFLKLEPLAEWEAEAASSISQSEYSVYSEKLVMICEEAKEVLMRTAVTEMTLAGDVVIGVYTGGGDLVTALCGTYIHAVSGGPAIKYAVRRWKDEPSVGVKDGDFFFFNDPLFGALHSPDEAVVMPIFYQGELIAWTCSASQETEIGAIGPGLSAKARVRWHEGLKVQPIKIGENYRLREDLIDALARMTRLPEKHTLDIRARCAACDRVRLRVQELCQKMGRKFLGGIFRRMIMETEAGARRKIQSWHDGVYRHTMFWDSLGEDEGLVKFTLEATKKDDHITFDFTRASPENEGPWHSFAHNTVATIIMSLYQGPFTDLPPSAGLFGCLDFKYQRGTYLHASEVASTMMAPPTTIPVWLATMVIVSKMMYPFEEDRSRAFSGGAWGGSCTYAGVNQHGAQLAEHMALFRNTVGLAARCETDGVDAAIFCYSPWGKAPDVEDQEDKVPWFHLFFSHLRDSGGFGRRRGGASTVGACAQYHTPYVGIAQISPNSRAFSTTAGLFAGYPGSAFPGIVIKRSDVLEHLKNGGRDLPGDLFALLAKKEIKGNYVISHNTRAMQLVERGDIYVVYSGAAGGCGDVLDREPELVMKDLKDEVISPWVARNVYRIAYDAESLQIDLRATEKLRQREHGQRKKRGQSYKEFEADWVKLRPPAKALEWFGSWPDGKPNREVHRF